MSRGFCNENYHSAVAEHVLFLIMCLRCTVFHNHQDHVTPFFVGASCVRGSQGSEVTVMLSVEVHGCSIFRCCVSASGLTASPPFYESVIAHLHRCRVESSDLIRLLGDSPYS
jgi:hypothetical protein